MKRHKKIKVFVLLLLSAALMVHHPASAMAEAPNLVSAEAPNPASAEAPNPRSAEAVKGSEVGLEGYEVYNSGSGNHVADTLRKGRKARITAALKCPDLKTGDIDKNDISISKLKDSFKMKGTPKVKITSGKDETLEFTVTFSDLTYLGNGNELKFQIASKRGGIASEEISVTISECEEYEGKPDSGAADISGQPVIRIKKLDPQIAIGAGERFTLILELENSSTDSDIEDLVVTVNPGGGLFIAEDTNTRLVKRLNSRQTTKIQIEMLAGQEMTGPYQALDLELKYNYYSGGNLTGGTSAQKLQLSVKNVVQGQPQIRISRNEIGTIEAGQAFGLVICMENTSQNKGIRNLTATFEPSDQISLQEQTDVRIIGDLAAGQAVEIPVQLKAGAELSGAGSVLFGLQLKFDYDSDKGVIQGTYGEKIVIPSLSTKKTTGAPTPNIIIGNYTYGDKITAGQVFDLEMELSNTSSQLPLENIVMSLDTGEGLSINSSSNTRYIARLNAGETKKEQLKVQALFQSKLQSPKITITFKYEYIDQKERKQASSTEVIAIPVYQPERFELKTPVFSENLRTGEEGTVSVPYANKGRGQIFNVEAVLECEVKALEKNLTVGNFEPGKTGTLDFVITPQQPGQFEGQVKITYEDEAMELKTAVVPISFTVQEGISAEAGAEGEGMFQAEEPKTSGRGPLILTGLAAATLLLAGLIRRKKKQKQTQIPQEAEWDEEEPEE